MFGDKTKTLAFLFLGVMIGYVSGTRGLGYNVKGPTDHMVPPEPLPSPTATPWPTNVVSNCSPSVVAKAIHQSMINNPFFDAKVNNNEDFHVRFFAELMDQRSDGSKVLSVVFEQNGAFLLGHVIFHRRSCTVGDMIYGTGLTPVH